MARTIFVLLLSLLGASALQLQPVTRAVTPLRVPAAPVCQFGGKPDTEQKGLSRDNEPEDFFKSDWGARGRRTTFSARCTSARSSPAERRRSPAPVHQTAHHTCAHHHTARCFWSPLATTAVKTATSAHHHPPPPTLSRPSWLPSHLSPGSMTYPSNVCRVAAGLGEAQEPGGDRRGGPDRGAVHYWSHRVGRGAMSCRSGSGVGLRAILSSMARARVWRCTVVLWAAESCCHGGRPSASLHVVVYRDYYTFMKNVGCAPPTASKPQRS